MGQLAHGRHGQAVCGACLLRQQLVAEQRPRTYAKEFIIFVVWQRLCSRHIHAACKRLPPHTPCLGLPRRFSSRFCWWGPWRHRQVCVRDLACCRYRRKGKNTLRQCLEVCCRCCSTTCPTHMTCLGRPAGILFRQTVGLWKARAGCVQGLLACYSCCCSERHCQWTHPEMLAPAVVCLVSI